MTKQDILERFKDIDFMYNDSSRLDTLSRMIDELQEAEISKISNAYLDLVGKASKQPEIVRCKDCKQSGIDTTSYPHYWCSAHAEYHDGYWFCADGKRKQTFNGDVKGGD